MAKAGTITMTCMDLINAKSAEELEGTRLASFFAASAHEGYEAVRHRKVDVMRPDDKALDYFGSACLIAYCQIDAFPAFATISIDDEWACTIYQHEIKPALALQCAWFRPVIAEVQGTLRSWEAMRRG